MRYLKYFVLLGILLMGAGYAQAQVRLGVGVGPVYAGMALRLFARMATTGITRMRARRTAYYGPDWFVGGVFIGAGPWYHGLDLRSRGYYGRPGWAYGRGGYGYRGG